MLLRSRLFAGDQKLEAARCRDLAAKSRDAEAMKRWLRMAVEYEHLADSMAGLPSVPNASGNLQVQRQSMQRQEVQQQQAKTETDEKG